MLLLVAMVVTAPLSQKLQSCTFVNDRFNYVFGVYNRKFSPDESLFKLNIGLILQFVKDVILYGKENRFLECKAGTQALIRLCG
jgi:hypothetical protein